MDEFYKRYPLVSYQVESEASPFPTNASLVATKRKLEKVESTLIKLFTLAMYPFNVPVASITNGTGLVLVNIVKRTETTVDAISYGVIDFGVKDNLHYTTKHTTVKIANPRTLDCATAEFRLLSVGDGCTSVSEPLYIPSHLMNSRYSNRTFPINAPRVHDTVAVTYTSPAMLRIKHIKDAIDLQRNNILLLNVIETALLDEGFESLMLVIRRNRHNKQFYSGLLSYVNSHVTASRVDNPVVEPPAKEPADGSMQTALIQPSVGYAVSDQLLTFPYGPVDNELNFISLLGNPDSLDEFYDK